MRLGTGGGGLDPDMTSAAFADIVFKESVGILKSQRVHVNVVRLNDVEIFLSE